MPVFISFFMGLREMATTPVESMKSGGILWFTDLTLPDQYFAMPIITSLTLWATIEVVSMGVIILLNFSVFSFDFSWEQIQQN